MSLPSSFWGKMVIELVVDEEKIVEHPLILNLRTGKIVKEYPLVEAVRYRRDGVVELGDGFRHHKFINQKDWNGFLKSIRKGEAQTSLALLSEYWPEQDHQTLVDSIKKSVLRNIGFYAKRTKRLNGLSQALAALRRSNNPYFAKESELYKKREKECDTFGHRKPTWYELPVYLFSKNKPLDKIIMKGECSHCLNELSRPLYESELEKTEHFKIEKIVL